MSAQQPPKALQDDYLALQGFAENIAAVSQNIRSLTTLNAEKRKAVEELSEMEEDVTVYKQVGSILFNSNKKAILEGLEEDILTNEMRIKSYNRKLDDLKKGQAETTKRFEEKYANFIGKQQ